MSTSTHLEIDSELIDSIRQFPVCRTVEHCGETFSISPFSIYATCPRCGTKIKVRSFSAVPELEDVFDAVFEWMLNPIAAVHSQERVKEIKQDLGEHED